MLLAEPKAKVDNTYVCTKTLIIYDITKSESNNVLLYIVLKKIKQTHHCKEPKLILLLEIMHCVHSLQIQCNSKSSR